MTTRTWLLGDGLTSGTALSTANTKAVDGTAATSVSAGTGGSITASSAQAHDGGLSMSVSSPASISSITRLPFPTSTTQGAIEFYIYLAGNPGISEYVFTVRSSTGVIFRGVITSSGKLMAYDSAATVLAAASTGTVTTGGWARISCVYTISATVGSIALKAYTGNSTTPDASTSGSSLNLGTSAAASIDLGRPAANANTFSAYFDTVQMSDSATSEIGPYSGPSNVAPTVTAGGTQTVAAGTSVTFSFSASDDVAVSSLTGTSAGPAAVTLTGTASGTSASASRTYAPTGTFTTPGVYTVTATATDASSATGTASTTVFVYPASGTYAFPVAATGSWTNVGGAADLITAITDGSVSTYGEAAPGTPLLVTLAPQGPGAITVGVEGYWSVGTVSRTLTLYKADGTTQIDTVTYDPTGTDNEKLWAVSTTQTNSIIPAATDRQALILKIQDA